MAHRPHSLAESYQHGLGVAKNLADWRMSPELQAAGILHSFVCKDILSAQEVAQSCGQRTAFLCKKYGEILQQQSENQRRGKLQSFKLVKLYMAAYCDLDLAFLNAASLWDHFIWPGKAPPPYNAPLLMKRNRL